MAGITAAAIGIVHGVRLIVVPPPDLGLLCD
jgi:hypothetical protein